MYTTMLELAQASAGDSRSQCDLHLAYRFRPPDGKTTKTKFHRRGITKSPRIDKSLLGVPQELYQITGNEIRLLINKELFF
jgi:hypothetical protein